MKKIVFISFVINFIIADYASDIQPIFDSNCTSCHGYPNQYGDLVLFSYDDLMNSGTVVPGDASSSSLYDRITREESENGDMPPTGSLSDEEIALIEAWINNGANETDAAVSGCTDPNAITCDDEIDPVYFPECATCSDGIVCDNYYNPEATQDNGSCMYNDVPTAEQFEVTLLPNGGCNVDWSAFTPPVDILQYVLQRCLDPDGDSDGDGELEYENCTMISPPGANFLGTSYEDVFESEDSYFKYTLYVHYPNNNYWGSAFGLYYYETTEECTVGDLNADSQLNVQDIVALVSIVLSGSEATCAADINNDGIANVIDIVSLVNIILSK